MSDEFVNRITLECLLNKEMYSSQIIPKKKESSLSKEEKKKYRKRVYKLLRDMLEGSPPDDLFLDVKSTCDTFVGSTINYFKVIDKSAILQAEHNDMSNNDMNNNDMNNNDMNNNDMNNNDISNNTVCSINDVSDYNSCLLPVRSIKIDVPTLDKYITRTTVKKNNITI